MARTKDPHRATLKSWETRRRNLKEQAPAYQTTARDASGSGVSQQRSDWARGERARLDTGEARELRESLERNGGFTYHVVSDRSPKEGFIVSIHPERSVAVDVDKLTPDMLRQYVKENRDLLRKRGNYFGAWKDEGRVYLDVSTVVKSKAEAVRLGMEHDQIGVYDIRKGETVIVDRNAKSGGA